jgi:hypothetical protein
VHLEEKLEDVLVGGPLGVEDDLDRLGVTRVVIGGRVVVLPAGVADAGGDDSVAVAQQFLRGPETAPARIAVSVFSLIAVLPPNQNS